MLAPPPNQGLTVLDRSKFLVPLTLLVALINPKFISKINQTANKNDLLDIRGVSRIVTVNRQKGVLFNCTVENESDLSPETTQVLSAAGAKFEKYTLQLNYNHWTTDEVLKSVLPVDLGEVPSGFSTVGHIAHMNLRDQFLPYKYLIGQVILDKNPALRTVVNKLDTIHTVFRTFDMEVIAGEDEFFVQQKESNCVFEFDFRKVYWNSRLHTEHDRLVARFKEGEAVCDPFAGVGPFAVPAGKKNVIVFANDLNPESYKASEHNIDINKVGHSVFAFNQDARDFIRSSIDSLQQLANTKAYILAPQKHGKNTPKRAKVAPLKLKIPRYYSHFVMNLPDSAIEFLDAFRGLYSGKGELPLPMIHVHCFFKHAPQEEPEVAVVHESLAKRVSAALGFELTPDAIEFHNVRRVAPTKEMYCLSFELPREVAYAL